MWEGKRVKLYNMLFPTYLLWLIPSTWIVILPANFLIDSAVLLLTLTALKLPRAAVYKRTILRIWGFGFLADLIASAFLFAVSNISFSLARGFDNEELRSAVEWFRLAVEYNPFHKAPALLVTLAGIALAGVCIYHFNLKCSVGPLELEPAHKKRLSLMLAIFTAPYMLLIPGEWFF